MSIPSMTASARSSPRASWAHITASMSGASAPCRDGRFLLAPRRPRVMSTISGSISCGSQCPRSWISTAFVPSIRRARSRSRRTRTAAASSSPARSGSSSRDTHRSNFSSARREGAKRAAIPARPGPASARAHWPPTGFARQRGRSLLWEFKGVVGAGRNSFSSPFGHPSCRESISHPYRAHHIPDPDASEQAGAKDAGYVPSSDERVERNMQQNRSQHPICDWDANTRDPLVKEKSRKEVAFSVHADDDKHLEGGKADEQSDFGINRQRCVGDRGVLKRAIAVSTLGKDA